MTLNLTQDQISEIKILIPDPIGFQKGLNAEGAAPVLLEDGQPGGRTMTAFLQNGETQKLIASLTEKGGGTVVIPPSTSDFKFPTVFGMNGTVKFFDIYQGDDGTDFAKAKAAGFHAVAIKVSQGVSIGQASAGERAKLARAEGLVVQFYHFYDPNHPGVDQANWFLSQCERAGGIHKGDAPPCLDFELQSGSLVPSRDNPIAESFINVVQHSPLNRCETPDGVKVEIYASVSALPELGHPAYFMKCWLWAAEYGVNAPKLSQYGWPAERVYGWQYGAGAVSGWNGGQDATDVDEFNGTLETLQAFVNPAPAIIPAV